MGTKEQTRELLLEAAESLFLERGILAVSMEDIAVQASCTRRNLYRYFETKEGLSIEVLRKLLAPWNHFQTETFRNLREANLSGRQEFESFLKELASYLEIHKSLLRFTAEFDFIFRDRNSFRLQDSDEQKLYEEFRVSEQILVRILERGEDDGTLKISYPMSVLVPTITTVLWGLGQRVALRETLIPIEFGVQAMELVQTQIDLFISALSNKERT
ncbi:TetR/AcrR family transcriptional regulator [Leptospira sarikeiensis]|uniref:TetR/AcrR family transcriptional regulator n=1 Tax=Leptospira sarikeiensis TaxID=2484943 RepID=A0A4R9KEM0_9LEPT|nr:TetR/AcrR family transcriptional regulator [Leptospira sarikeiensis]TGL63663.1 TetR/AcrR family transcriptional regulator [Leptospira sarikeiensis]